MIDIHPDLQRPDPTMVDRFRAVRMDAVAQQLDNASIADPAIKPIGGSPRIAGPVVTVALTAPDFEMGVLAIGVARRGDIILLAANGSTAGAVWGGGLSLSADEIGCEAVVVDGMAIDAAAIVTCRTPVFARGTTLRRAAGPNPGSINIPVIFGGIRIEPGDLMIGDADGLCVVPKARLEEVLVAAEEHPARVIGAKAAIVGTGKTIFDLYGGRALAARRGMIWHEPGA